MGLLDLNSVDGLVVSPLHVFFQLVEGGVVRLRNLVEGLLRRGRPLLLFLVSVLHINYYNYSVQLESGLQNHLLLRQGLFHPRNHVLYG